MEINLNPPILKIVTGDGQYLECPLNRGVNVLGRKSQQSSDISSMLSIELNDMKMSRRHCKIEWDINGQGENFLLLSDLGSSNGTILSGYRNGSLGPNEEIYLVHNDEVTLGETKVTIILPLNLPMVKALIVEKVEKITKTAIWGSKR